MKKSMTIRGRFGKWREKRMIIRKNKELCERFPFLIPWHRFTGERFVQLDRHGKMKAVHDYDWSYTELDSMPDGWRKAFGMKMCEEIREELIKWNDLDRWQIIEMKEKYGQLRIYDSGIKIGCRIHDIERKYEQISERTCIVCGAPATKMTLGWISPYCDKCCPDEHSEPIGKYLKGEDTIV